MVLYQEKIKKALQRAVEEVFGRPIETFVGTDKKPENVRIRQIIISLYKDETDASMKEISREFNFSYEVVVYALERREDNLRYDKVYSKNFVSLQKSFQKFIA